MPIIDAKPRATRAEGTEEFRGGNPSPRTPFRPLPPRSHVSANHSAPSGYRRAPRTLLRSYARFGSRCFSLDEYFPSIDSQVSTSRRIPSRSRSLRAESKRRVERFTMLKLTLVGRTFTITMRAFSSRTADSVPNRWCSRRSPESNPRI